MPPLKPEADELVPITPVAVDRTEVAKWSTARPTLFRLAELWARRGPRATSSIPRRIGRMFGRSWRTVVSTPDGIKLAVDPWNLDVYTEILRRGGHEPHVVRVCASLLRDGETFYDIGASAGYFSLSVARRHPSSLVFAFEPQPTLAACLARSALLNGASEVVVIPAVVGARDGTTSLFVPAHSLHASTAADAPDSRVIRTYGCRLDSLVASGAIRSPDVIKIDVEGGERDVLAGAEATIRAHQPALVYESIAENTQKYGYAPAELIEVISRLGDYEFVGLRPDGGCVPQERISSDSEVQDVAAVPASRAHWPEWRQSLA